MSDCMDKFLKHYVEQKKPNTENYLLCGLYGVLKMGKSKLCARY